MDIEEMRQAASHARADAAEAKTRDARVDLAQAAHQLAMTAEICERLERIEAALRALGPADLRGHIHSERSDAGDGSAHVGVTDRDRPVRPRTIG
jgi:hypothetical protein